VAILAYAMSLCIGRTGSGNYMKNKEICFSNRHRQRCYCCGDELARKRMQVGITSHSYFGESFRTLFETFFAFSAAIRKKCLASAVNVTELLRLRSTSIFYKNAEHSDLHI